MNAAVRGHKTLPPELVDMVIDYLYHDKPALSACTLVSRTWLATSRMHLFNQVIIYHDRTPRPFGRFTDFLREKPFIRTLIKIMCMNGYHSSDPRQGLINASVLDDIIKQLPGLETLYIVNCFWQSSFRGAMRGVPLPVPAYRATLKDLIITHFSAEQEATHSKLELLRHFRKLEKLKLDHVWLGHFALDTGDGDQDEPAELDYEHWLQDLRPSVPGHPEVEELTLSFADVCLNFLAYLWRQPFISTLTSLTIQDLFQATYLQQHEDLLSIGEAIRDIFGSQLTYLELDMPRLGPNDLPECFTELCLSSCTSLERVRLNLLLDPVVDWSTDDPEDEPHDQSSSSSLKASPSPSPSPSPAADDASTATSTASTSTATTSSATIPAQQPHPPPSLYSQTEWSSLIVVLNSLPRSIKSLVLTIELPEDAFAVLGHLQNIVDWPALVDALRRFNRLERLVVQKTVTNGDFPVMAEWDLESRRLWKMGLAEVPRLEGRLGFRR